MAVERANEYQGAAPFPNICIDDFLPEETAHALSAAFPSHDDIGWIERDNKNNRRRYQHDETKLPYLLREMLREFNSRQFTLFLETLTGIDCLLPDPYFIGGGAHMSTTGDFLNIHADFNWHHKLQAYRRVNALLYLPERWEPEWHGARLAWQARELIGDLDDVGLLEPSSDEVEVAARQHLVWLDGRDGVGRAGESGPGHARRIAVRQGRSDAQTEAPGPSARAPVRRLVSRVGRRGCSAGSE